MTAVQAIAVVLIRLWAVGAVIAWLYALSSAIGGMFSGSEIYQGLVGYLHVASFGLILAFWTLVLCYSKTVTMWILPPVREADHRIRIEPVDLVQVGTFLVGVFYLTKYVPDLLRSAPAMIMQYMQGAGSWSYFSGRAIDLAVSVIAILIALWLVLRPRHIVKLFAWLRRAGQETAEPARGDAPKAE